MWDICLKSKSIANLYLYTDWVQGIHKKVGFSFEAYLMALDEHSRGFTLYNPLSIL